MTQDALARSLERIERAVARIERAERSAAAVPPGLAEAFALLDERHGLLRAQVETAITQMDALIGAGPHA